MPSRLKTTLVTLTIATLLMIVLGLGFATLLRNDTGLLKDAMEWSLGKVLGRKLVIGELVEADLGRSAYLVAENVSLTNLEESDTPDFAAAGRVLLHIDLPSLWRDGPVLIHKLELDDAYLNLLTPDDRSPNWQFRQQDDGRASRDDSKFDLPVFVNEGLLSRVTVTYRTPDQNLVVILSQLDLSDETNSGTLTLGATGKINGKPFAASGRLGSSLALLEGGNADADLQIDWGELQVKGRGTVTDLATLKALDLHLSISTPDRRPLLEMLGMSEVPDGPMELAGRITDAKPGFLLDAQGAMNEFSLQVNGTIERPWSADGVDLALKISTPSMAETGRIFNSDAFPDVPYQASGELQRNGSRMTVKLASENLQLQLSSNIDDEMDRGTDTSGLQLDVEARGPDLLEFLPVGAWSETDLLPFDIRTRVSRSDREIRFSEVQAKAGKSDLSGSIVIVQDEVPVLDIDLHSTVVDISFLLPEPQPVEAAETSADLSTYTDKLTQQELKDRVIPDTPIDLSLFEGVTGSLRYEVEKLYFREGASFRATARLSLEDRRLVSDQLQWEGKLDSGEVSLVIDAARELPSIEFELEGKRIPLLWLVFVDQTDQRGSLYRLRLSSVGRSPRELASRLNGVAAFMSGGGKIYNRGLDLLVSDLMGGIFSRLNPATDDEYTIVECGAGAMTVQDGLVQAVPGLAVRTDKVDLVSAGTVDLNDETINMAFSTRSRQGVGISAGKAVTPYIKLGGTLAHPFMTLDPKGAAISGGAAIATSGLSILAGGLWDRWVATAEDPCKQLIKAARENNQQDYRSLINNENASE